MSRDRDRDQKRLTLRRLFSMAMFVLGVAALVKEIRTPADKRQWNGIIAGFVPYDFRPPTLERMKARLWNEDGPLVGPQVFGVGWTVNAGAIKRILGGA